MTSSRNTTVGVVLATLLLGIGSWFVFANSEPRVGDESPAAGAVRRETETVTPVRATATTSGANETAAAARERATDAIATSATDATTQHVLRVRLRGLHPGAPWTTPLMLDIDEAQQQVLGPGPTAPVDAEGRAQFVLRDWVAKVTKGAIQGVDPNYQPLRQPFEGPLDFTTELVVDVQVVARIEGRVVDSYGTPVANTRVTAFEMCAGKPLDAVLTTTTPHPFTGRYAMRVPPGVPLLLFATPVDDSSFILPETKDLAADAPHTTSVRHDLLPVSVLASGVVGTPTQVADLVLQTAATMRGSVRWTDGAPIEGALVYVRPRDGVGFETLRGAVYRLDDGRVASVESVRSQADGTFSMMRVAPGIAFVLRVVTLQGRQVIGECPERTIVAPQSVEFVIPRPVMLRAVDATTGGAVAKPRFEFEGTGRKSTGSVEGTLEAVVLSPAKVRATKGRMRSPWVEVTPDQAGAALTLRLGDALCPLTIVVDGAAELPAMTIDWRRTDGREGREQLARESPPAPFTIHLEPGQYHLRILLGIDPDRSLLLPVERDVEVASEPVELVVPSRPGGKFVLWATDASGRHVAGTCRVTSAAGEDVTDGFVLEHGSRGRFGDPGEVMAGGPCRFARTLPPGDYELQCDFVEHGARRTKVTIEARKVTEVRIRL